MKYWIGIDIGGTKIAAASISEDFEVLYRTEVRTPVESRSGPAVLGAVDAIIEKIGSLSPGHLQGIGVGSGGQIDSVRGVVLSATDVIPGWSGTDIAGHLARVHGVRAAADNDVNVLALCESTLGAGRAKGTVVYLSLGTGVGGALVIDGQVHHGAHWCGGEFGHILLSIDPQARADLGGARGTLEAYASGGGLAANYQELAGECSATVTGIEIGKAAQLNPHSLEAEAVRKTGEYLGYGIVSLLNALDPDLVVVGGGLASLGDLLLDPARKVVRERALPGAAHCPIVPSSLGPDAPVIGAALLIMQQQRKAFTPL